jgi:carboxymethylenebutenolidase
MRITLSTGTPAELAVPESEAVGGLVLWTDIFGLRPLFDAHCQRLANALRVTVVAPELFPGQESLDVETRLGVVGELADASKMADLDAAILATGSKTVNTLGFCMGGMYAMKSLGDPRVQRAVAFYGMVRLPERWQSPVQHDAIDSVRARAAAGPLSLLCIFGGDDPWCPEEDQELVAAAGAEVVLYPGAGHGWAQDPARSDYREADAEDAWLRAEAYLGATNAPWPERPAAGGG